MDMSNPVHRDVSGLYLLEREGGLTFGGGGGGGAEEPVSESIARQNHEPVSGVGL